MTGSLAYELTRRLGGDWHGGYGLVPAPGHSKRDRSLSVRLHPHNASDIILHSFAGEDWKAIKTEFRRNGLLPTDHRAPTKAAARALESEAAEQARSLQKVLWLWDQSLPAKGTVVEHYLRWRGIEIDPLPALIRYLPAQPPKHPWPAMIAPFGMADEPEPGRLALHRRNIKGVHLTLLERTGNGKAPIAKKDQRKTIGRGSLASPIALTPVTDGLGLLIGEGIETVLWGYQAAPMGAWAAGPADRMPALAAVVPNYVECVTIAMDADPAGERFATGLAERLATRGFEVRIPGGCHGA